jgi:hypothetical protein
VSLVNLGVENNSAKRGTDGTGAASGHFTGRKRTVSLDASTLAHVINNTTTTSDPNIDGSGTLT